MHRSIPSITVYISHQIQIKHKSKQYIDIVTGDISDDLKKQMKEKVPDDPTKTMGLYSLVQIATGAKYDLTSNIDVTDGLTNGAECIIENIDYRVVNSSRPSIIWVSFSDPGIWQKTTPRKLPSLSQ